jgi:hypothetical protein
VKPLIAPLCAFVFLSMLSGCWNGRVLISFERPYWASLGDDARTRLAIARESLPRGYLPRFDLGASQGTPMERLTREIGRTTYAAVVIGPMLSLEWQAYAATFPGTRFILIGVSTAAQLPPNALAIRYDRTRAFAAAGFAAGASVREAAGATLAPTLASRVGVIRAGAALSEEEVRAFSDGVGEALNGGTPAVREVAPPVEKQVLKSVLEQMRGEGVEVFLLGAGSMDAWCLEVLRSTGGCAVVADWSASGAFPRQVFLSIEEDVPGGIGRALAEPAAVEPAAGSKAVSGPVRILTGTARRIPPGAQARLKDGVQ